MITKLQTVAYVVLIAGIGFGVLLMILAFGSLGSNSTIIRTTIAPAVLVIWGSYVVHAAILGFASLVSNTDKSEIVEVLQVINKSLCSNEEIIKEEKINIAVELLKQRYADEIIDA
ncbi:MAG: hypothetical protein E7241_11030 [Lachnospiraceae bacterium]|nr:hypothetical protein [Lachnospiraceae bacterium]